MKALVYHGPGNKAWEETPDPVLIDDTDAIVRVEATTICGTDLHILQGDVPAVTDGRAGRLVTHHFELDDIEHAYDVFEHAADTDALKVVLAP